VVLMIRAEIRREATTGARRKRHNKRNSAVG